MAALVAKEATVKVWTLWVDYSSEGEDLMPNLVLAVDEYLDDENPDYWVEHFELERRKAEEFGYSWRVVEMRVPEKAILDAFQVKQVEVEVVQ